MIIGPTNKYSLRDLVDFTRKALEEDVKATVKKLALKQAPGKEEEPKLAKLLARTKEISVIANILAAEKYKEAKKNG